MTALTFVLAALDINVILNVATLVGLVIGVLILGPRAYKARQAQADLAEKDRTIATYTQSHAAFEERIRVLEGAVQACDREIAALRERNSNLQQVNAALQQRAEAMAKYTAQEALNTVRELMIEQNAQAQHRHEEMLRVLTAVAEAAGERRAQNIPPLSP